MPVNVHFSPNLRCTCLEIDHEFSIVGPASSWGTVSRDPKSIDATRASANAAAEGIISIVEGLREFVSKLQSHPRIALSLP